MVTRIDVRVAVILGVALGLISAAGADVIQYDTGVLATSYSAGWERAAHILVGQDIASRRGSSGPRRH